MEEEKGRRGKAEKRRKKREEEQEKGEMKELDSGSRPGVSAKHYPGQERQYTPSTIL